MKPLYAKSEVPISKIPGHLILKMEDTPMSDFWLTVSDILIKCVEVIIIVVSCNAKTVDSHLVTVVL